MHEEKEWIRNPLIAKAMPHIIHRLVSEYPEADVDLLATKAEQQLIPNPFIWESAKEEWKRALAGLLHYEHLHLFYTAFQEALDNYLKHPTARLRNTLLQLATDAAGATIKVIEVLGPLGKYEDVILDGARIAGELAGSLILAALKNVGTSMVQGVEDAIRELPPLLRMRAQIELSRGLMQRLQWRAAIEVLTTVEGEAISALERGVVQVIEPLVVSMLMKAECLLYLGLCRKSVSAFERVLDYVEKITDHARALELKCRALLGLARALELLEEYSRALSVLDECERASKELCEISPNKACDLAKTYAMRARILDRMGRHREALDELKRAEIACRSVRETKACLEVLAEILSYEVEILLKLGLTSDAEKCAKQIEQIYNKLGTARLRILMLMVKVNVMLKRMQARDALTVVKEIAWADIVKERATFELFALVVRKHALVLAEMGQRNQVLEKLKEAEKFCRDMLSKGRDEFRFLLAEVLRVKSDLLKMIGMNKLAVEARKQALKLLAEDCAGAGGGI